MIHTQGWPLRESDSLGRRVPLPPGERPGRAGLRHRARLQNPWVSPFEEFQRWKQHPAIREILEGGKRVAYGARAINEGGWQSVPKLAFPGGALIGCSAGFVNVPRIKGSHTAMKSGMLAAEAIAAAIAARARRRRADGIRRGGARRAGSPTSSSWCRTRSRWSPSSAATSARSLAGVDMWLRTLKHRPAVQHEAPPRFRGDQRADLYRPIAYPKPDGVISFDRLTIGVAFCFTNHEEDQPCHLVLKDLELPDRDRTADLCRARRALLPGGGLRMASVDEDGEPQLQINAQNCVHCKTCDIKDPNQNIELGHARRRRRAELSEYVTPALTRNRLCQDQPRAARAAAARGRLSRDRDAVRVRRRGRRAERFAASRDVVHVMANSLVQSPIHSEISSPRH